MTDPNQTVAEFLLARLDEDEAAARRHQELADRVGRVYGHPDAPEGELNLGDLAYFAIHDQAAHALADIAAKRRIVELMQEQREYQRYTTVHETVLCHLASVYADHPDYRQEWAVEPPATGTDTRHVFYNGEYIGQADPSDSNTV